MKHIVLADLEGASGVFTEEQCTTGTPAWKKARFYLTSNLNALIRGINSVDKEAIIVVRDLHNQGYNIIRNDLDPSVKYIGGPYHKPIMWFGDLEGYDIGYMTGIHARSGSKGFQPHTQCLEFADVKINGKSICEVEFTASVIAEETRNPYPIVLVSGEQIAIDQAKESLPWIEGVPIAKELEQTDLKSQILIENKQIFNKTCFLLQNFERYQKYKFDLPLDVNITYFDKKLAQRIASRWNLELNNSTIRFQADSTHNLINMMIRMMYLTPFLARFQFLTPLLRPIYRYWAR